MSNLTDFFPSGGGGGLTPKFQEFNTSGTFTPTQALIDAGGYIEVFLVGGGGQGRAAGGEVLIKKMYLTNINSLTVTIASGATSVNSNGGNSLFNGSSAGGTNLTAGGGYGGNTTQVSNQLGSGWSSVAGNNAFTAGGGVLGYGAGAAYETYTNEFVYYGGIKTGKANSGQGSPNGQTPGSGYCLIKWYE
tara:strand:+ start:63 stop:632 length:570 start_codon:yes stop_codon:yes gene_type:complete